MYFKRKILGYRIAAYCRKVQRVDGVNSNLRGGMHMVLLDVEKCSLRQIENEAARLIELFNLGPAYIFSTGRPDHWHLYFLSRVDWGKAMRVACSCVYEDPNHIGWSLKRGHFTLRIGQKGGRQIEFVSRIESHVEPDVVPEALRSFTRYETAVH